MSSNSEIHHYIKNILQAIISYTNTAVMGKKAPSEITIRKLHSFIHVLSYIQDRVFENSPLNFKCDIRADLVLQKAVELMCNSEDMANMEFPEIYCPVKRATNLALIALEIISCLRNCGNENVQADLKSTEGGLYILKIFSKNSSTIDEKYLTSELKLAGLIAKSDFNTNLDFELGQKLSVSVTFDLQQKI